MTCQVTLQDSRLLLHDFTLLSVAKVIMGHWSAGMGRYKPVRHALDILLHQDALETMLQKTPAAIDSHGVAGRICLLSIDRDSCIQT